MFARRIKEECDIEIARIKEKGAIEIARIKKEGIANTAKAVHDALVTERYNKFIEERDFIRHRANSSHLLSCKGWHKFFMTCWFG